MVRITLRYINIVTLLMALGACEKGYDPDRHFYQDILLSGHFRWLGLERMHQQEFRNQGGYELQLDENNFISSIARYDPQAVAASFPGYNFHKIEFYHVTDDDILWEWYFTDEDGNYVPFTSNIWSFVFYMDYQNRPFAMVIRDEDDMPIENSLGIMMYYFLQDEKGRPAKVMYYDRDTTRLTFTHDMVATVQMFDQQNRLIRRRFMDTSNRFLDDKEWGSLGWNYPEEGPPKAWYEHDGEADSLTRYDRRYFPLLLLQPPPRP